MDTKEYKIARLDTKAASEITALEQKISDDVVLIAYSKK